MCVHLWGCSMACECRRVCISVSVFSEWCTGVCVRCVIYVLAVVCACMCMCLCGWVCVGVYVDADDMFMCLCVCKDVCV